MKVARAEFWKGEALYPSLRILSRAAMTLRQMVGEDVVGCDYEIFVVQAGEPFAPRVMVDEYAPEKRAKRAGVQVVGSLSLGLRRERESGSGNFEGQDAIKILVKPQVILQTIANDLDL